MTYEFPNLLKIQLIKIIRINKTHNHIGCGFQSYGDGGFEPASRGPDTHLSTCVVY